MKCPLCDAGDTGRIWSKEILTGRKNIEEAALFFKTTSSQVQTHVYEHYQPELIVEDTVQCEPEDFYLRELHKLLKQLKDLTTYCVKSSDMSNRDIETMVKLVKETRDTLKVLGEFEGRINKQAQVQVNIGLINDRYEKIQNFLLTEACDECKMKMIDLMDQLTISSTSAQ